MPEKRKPYGYKYMVISVIRFGVCGKPETSFPRYVRKGHYMFGLFIPSNISFNKKEVHDAIANIETRTNGGRCMLYTRISKM